MQKALIIPSKLKAGAVIAIPGSKSYTNRALIIAALAQGETRLKNPLFSDDTKFTTQALKQLGVKIERDVDDLVIQGSSGSFNNPGEAIYLGNAGTGMRILTAVLSITGFKTKITGNQRMRARPIKDLITALHGLGVKVESTFKNGCPPVRNSGNGIKGGTVEVGGKISSQFLTALLIIAPYADSDVEIVVRDELVSKPYVDMTIQIMKDFGVEVENQDYRSFKIACGQKYKSREYLVEGDASSASYFVALQKLHNVKLEILNIPDNSLQPDACVNRVLGTLTESTQEIDLNHMPDAAMTVAIMAAFKKGKTRIVNVANLRVKETDRIKALVTELNKVGCDAKELEDGIEINGDPKKLHGNTVIETYDDHRIAMCFAVLASKIPNVQILDPKCTGKTYPGFFKDLEKAGIKTEIKNIPNIYLTGMRGSGKSTIGKQLAKLLRAKFYDSDAEIERQEKMKILQIVKKKSWFHFRKIEKYIIRRLAKKNTSVISTGGGVILDKENVNVLRKNGKIVFLKCDTTILAKRIEGDKNRPALTEQKTIKAELDELWEKREGKYLGSADLIFDSSEDLGLNEKAQQIIYQL